MDELTPGTRDILRAMQEEDSPTETETQRIRLGVMARIGAGAALGTATAAATQSAAATVATGTIIKGALLGALVAGTGAAVFTLGGEPAPEPPRVAPTAVVQSVEVPAEPEEAPEAVEPAADEETSEASEEEVALDEPKKTSRRVTRGAQLPGTQLGEEAMLLSKAHAALRSGNPRGAIQFLKEHQARFPTGGLRSERNAALAIAYCQAGDRTAGQARAEAFRRANPGSPMIGRLEAACDLKPQ